MDKNIVNILKNKINKYEKILLFFHSRPDLDAICSCLAFKKFIQNFNHKIKIEIARVSQINSFQTNLDLPKLKNKPKHFTKNCLGIIFDTANEERIAGVEYKNCDDFIRIDHHPKTESFGSIEIIDPKYAATCELLAEIFFM
jgi:phosphoesterase RecJ-like protein